MNPPAVLPAKADPLETILGTNYVVVDRPVNRREPTVADDLQALSRYDPMTRGAIYAAMFDEYVVKSNAPQRAQPAPQVSDYQRRSLTGSFTPEFLKQNASQYDF